MHYFLGTLALLGVGLIGLLIEIHKQDKKRIDELEKQLELTEWSHQTVFQKMKEFEKNQKPIPWNKGKKGYKLNRKSKETTLVLNTENPVIAAWDANGVPIMRPKWESISE